MKNLKLITSGLVLCMVALVYVVSYAQTTTPTQNSDDKKSCCMKMKEGESASCCAKMKEGSSSCCADGVCKMKDKNSAHADMKSGDCCKMKEKNANAQSSDNKTEACCASCCAGGSCCADGVCKMKDKNHAAQNSADKESCCSGGSCCGCCQKKAA